MRSAVKILMAMAFILLVSCDSSRNAREWQYVPDMYESPAIKAQENNPDQEGESYMRQPPEGSIPRDFVPYQLAAGDTLAAQMLVNPVPLTEEVLAAGEKYYDIFCGVCHGDMGAGDGPIIPKMTKPPVLYSEKVINWPDGRIYHTITHGQGNMPSYKSHIDPITRWTIIHYVRAIQKSQNPSAEDLQAVQ